MNIRKNIDYTDMYEALDSAMAENLSQVELYYEIGKAVCQRTEKGAAVAAASYLSEQYPDAQGFSPRNLRRMREFYRTYEGQADLLFLVLQLGWTQNVVIMEADLSVKLREWYLKAAKQFGWTKAELIEKIAKKAHETVLLTTHDRVYHTEDQKDLDTQNSVGICSCKVTRIENMILKQIYRMVARGDGQQHPTTFYSTFTRNRSTYVWADG